MTPAVKKRIANRVWQIFTLNYIEDRKTRIKYARDEYKLFVEKLEMGYFDEKSK